MLRNLGLRINQQILQEIHSLTYKVRESLLMATKIEKKSPIQINKFVFFIGVYLLQIGIKRYKTYFLRLKIITDIIFIIL